MSNFDAETFVMILKLTTEFTGQRLENEEDFNAYVYGNEQVRCTFCISE